MLQEIIKVLSLVSLIGSLKAERPQLIENLKRELKKSAVYQNVEDDKSSLVFVFDTTGSMYNDLKQLRDGAEMVLDTALEDSNVIGDFVFVPFHDPTVGPATVTKDKETFKAALNKVRVYGGGDCPEKSLSGITLALNVSRPRSFIYVFTDATASDHALVGKVLDSVQRKQSQVCPEKSLSGITLALNVSRPRSFIYVFTDATASDHALVGQVLDSVQRKQSQVVFVLTGHCNDLHRPSYKVYHRIAAASAGQVFNLNKTSVHKVLDFVRNSIKGRMVNLGSVVNAAGYNHTQGIPVDNTLGEVTVSVSGANPSIKVVDPNGEELTGPPKLITALDLSEIMVVKVLQPEPGNWTITTGSIEEYSVKVVGLSNLTFIHGFSVQRPNSMAETSYRPLRGTYNNMLISLTQTDRDVKIDYAEILSLSGRTLFEVKLHVFDEARKIYIADVFVPPDDLFYIAINGRDEYNQELRRIGATAIQSKTPDAPYLSAPHKIEARLHERVVLRCHIESLVPVTAMWTKDSVKIQPQASALQTTTIEYVIEDMDEGEVGDYRCVAKNVAGVNNVLTEVVLFVDPPEVSLRPKNKTLQLGDDLHLSCSAKTEALLTKYQFSFNGTRGHYVININIEPNVEGIYLFNKTIRNFTENEEGVYSCIARNRGGETTQSSQITIQTQPQAHILGPHTLTKQKHTNLQIVCHVENAERLIWIAPNGSNVKEVDVNGNFNDMLELYDVEHDGVWMCVAVRGSYRVNDSVELTVLYKPEVKIEGMKNITILNGTAIDIACIVAAKPAPRIIWHKETDRFLNHKVTVMKKDVYKSVLTLDSTVEPVNGTYFCFGENSEGIHQDFITVNVREKMKIVKGFSVTDKSVQLYSNLSLTCLVEAFPSPKITWRHNGTEIRNTRNIQLTENNTVLTVKRVGFKDLGEYLCLCDNGYEKLEIRGTVTVFGLEVPVLSKEQTSVVARKGDSIEMPCRILRGNPKPKLTLQFKKDSSVFTFLNQEVYINSSTGRISIRNVNTKHEGLYRCVAENELGSDFFEFVLIVQYPPELLQTSKDVIIEIAAGKKVTLSCEARGNPPPVVVWMKDGRPIGFSENIYLTETNNLEINKVSPYDSGLYTCNATSAIGFVEKNFTLIVYETPTILPTELKPEQEVLEGQLVDLPCTAKGHPKPDVMWLHNGIIVHDNRKIIDDFGLRFVANLTDFGEYTCLARNKYGNASSTFHVLVWVVPTILPPLEATKSVTFGDNVTLQCDAIGFPVPTILWEFNDRLFTENTTEVRFNEYGNIYLFNVTDKHEGVYYCIAENIAGIAKKEIHLSVLEPPKILEDNYTGPYIATSRDAVLLISCRASGKPKPYVLWEKDGGYLNNDPRYTIDIDGTLTLNTLSEDLSGLYTCIAKNVVGIANKTVPVQIYSVPERMQAEQTVTTVTVLEKDYVKIECPVHASSTDKVKWYKNAKLISTDTLQIKNISRSNSSTYACVVSNLVGSAHAIVEINVEWPPRFVDKLGENVEVVKGLDVYLNCDVDAKPMAKIKWYFNSRPLIGRDESRLKLMNVEMRQTGVYKCVVSNSHGTVVRQYVVDVLVPPFISGFDFLDVQLKEGSNATLECDARGSPTPHIRWTFNNTNWQVQNSSLVTYNASVNSEGTFRCDAVNKAGGAHMSYRVSVFIPAKVKDVVVYREGEIGGETVGGLLEVELATHIRVSCTSLGQPSPKIQWIYNGILMSENSYEINYADLILNKVEVKHSGLYSCIASNEGGSDERRIKIDVLEPPKIFGALFEQTSNNASKLEILSDQSFSLHCHPYGNPTPAVYWFRDEPPKIFGALYEPASDKASKIEILSDQSFSLHCHPYGNPTPTVYWFRDGQPLRFFDDSMVSSDFGEVITVDRARLEQSGNYTCVARNKVGETSLIYLVNVLVPPPTPKEHSKSITTRFGKELVLSCPVAGSPLPDVLWVKHPYTEISVDTPRVTLLDDNSVMIINNTREQDSGNYSCIMTNKVGTTEVVFDVTILKSPSIAGNVESNNVESHVVPLRRSIVLKCQGDGHPKPTITWLKDTQPLSSSVSNVQRVLGDSILAIWNINSANAGQYICVLQNVAGTAHRRYDVTVQVPGKWSPWSQWSFCNVSCGQGYQHRTRLCQYIDDNNTSYSYSNTTKSNKTIIDESSCKGPPTDRRKCNMPSCDEENVPRWSVWSKWSECSAHCGVGTQTRTRRCRVRGKCVGDNVQVRKCPDLPKCDENGGSSGNDIPYGEDGPVDANAFIPEATFEMIPAGQTERVYPQYATDFEEVYFKPEEAHPSEYYYVNVTENHDLNKTGPCDPGFSFNNATQTCEDVDECLIINNLCHSTQVCENTLGAYRCTCPKGFASLGIGQRCLDINECQQDTSGCEFACVNVAGGYVCACPKNLRLHTDKHHCVPPNYRSQYEEIDSKAYLSASIDYPAKYTKNRQ